MKSTTEITPLFTEYQYTRVTGLFAVTTSPDQAAVRLQALRECVRMRPIPAKEEQVPKQVALNLEMKRAEVDRTAALARL